MNPATADALAELRDIHLPEAVAFWPPAPGWWALAVLVVATAVGLSAWIRFRRRSVKRAALRELDAIRTGFSPGGDPSQLALRLSTLLRRVAISRFERRDVASLHGAEWSRFLVSTSGSGRLTAELVGDLSLAVYGPPQQRASVTSSEAWIDAVRDWIRENA